MREVSHGKIDAKDSEQDIRKKVCTLRSAESRYGMREVSHGKIDAKDSAEQLDLKKSPKKEGRFSQSDLLTILKMNFYNYFLSSFTSSKSTSVTSLSALPASPAFPASAFG